MQAQYDAYVANEVFPFIDSVCQTPGIPIATLERRSVPITQPTPSSSIPIM